MESSTEEIDCDKLVPGTDEYNQIYPFCKVKVYLLDRDGNVIENGSLEIEKCKKGSGCTTYETRTAICQKDTKQKILTTIRVEYEESKST